MISKILLVMVSVFSTAWSHGRLIDPPSRSTMWRPEYGGYPTPENYQDHELFCGGFDIQYRYNGGKCGICGDPWNATTPRENEDGGIYGKKHVVRTYRQGQVIEVTVEITAHHKGYFEYRLCPITDEDHQIADQECLDRHLLPLADGSGTRYPLPDKPYSGNFPVKLQLPEDLTCDRCVLQWHYQTGNIWEPCKGDIEAVGCVRKEVEQEVFRGCADIKIMKAEPGIPVSLPGGNKLYPKKYRNYECTP